MQSLLIVEPHAQFLTILRFQCSTEDLKCGSKLQAARFFFSSLTRQGAFKGMFHFSPCCTCFHSWRKNAKEEKEELWSIPYVYGVIPEQYLSIVYTRQIFRIYAINSSILYFKSCTYVVFNNHCINSSFLSISHDSGIILGTGISQYWPHQWML